MVWSGMVFFTVFTATYNRAYMLGRAYESLQAQAFRDFEWLIVDDGSSDNTAELVKAWQSEASFTIRYFYQPNSGKHVAFNRGVREAFGELFLTFDSDDVCEPNALERFRARWLEIPDGRRDQFSGITCLCKDEKGRLVGGALPHDFIDGHPFAVMSRLWRRAEMWGFHRTEVLRAYPFPEFQGERFVPEGLVWNRIGRRYKIRFINEALRSVVYLPDGLSASMVHIRLLSPQATMTYYAELIELPVRLTYRLRAAANLWRFALHSGDLVSALQAGRRHPLLIASGLMPGLLLAFRDARSGETKRSASPSLPKA